MKSIQKRWIEVAVFLCLCHTYDAFQAQPFSTRQTRTSHAAAVDPNDVVSFVSSDHANFPSEVAAFLSTALTVALPQGHSNPLFGPPDPYLAAGKSIAPSAKALMDMGVNAPQSVGDMLPEASESFQQSVAAAMAKGWKVLDASKLHGSGVNHLPGFSDTRGIFGTRQVPYDDPETFTAEVKWAAGYFRIMDKLPFVAFYYALAEFFVLRPGVDMYKEEIEEDPEGVLADTASVAIVRLGAFAFITFFTVIFAG